MKPSESRNIIFLYTRLADYFYQSIKFFISNNPDYKAIIIRYPADKDAPFVFEENSDIELIDKIKFRNKNEIIRFIENLKPHALYSSGWSDKDYRQIFKHFYQKFPTIVGVDNPWEGQIRQYLGLGKYRVFMNHTFSHIWVAGKPQYEFARRLGFSNKNIINDLYCANTKVFEKAHLNSLASKKISYPKKLLFIGRYVEYKQPLLLVKLFLELQKTGQINGWSLEFVGSGPLLEELKNYENDYIQVKGFTTPKSLPELLASSGAFCLPSKSEHWGVVVHEAAAAGLPLLLSNTTYAGTEFVINKFNGFLFDEKNISDFKKALIELFKKTDEELLIMGERSQLLSEKISHVTWAANLHSLL